MQRHEGNSWEQISVDRSFPNQFPAIQKFLFYSRSMTSKSRKKQTEYVSSGFLSTVRIIVHIEHLKVGEFTKG